MLEPGEGSSAGAGELMFYFFFMRKVWLARLMLLQTRYACKLTLDY